MLNMSETMSSKGEIFLITVSYTMFITHYKGYTLIYRDLASFCLDVLKSSALACPCEIF